MKIFSKKVLFLIMFTFVSMCFQGASGAALNEKVACDDLVDRPIKVYWWKCNRSKHGNFGDELSAKIIPKIFNKKVKWASQDDCDMLACGSIIEHFDKEKILEKILWTSGFRLDKDYEIGKSNKIIAVRGKLSESRIRKNDGQKLVLGDLGLLSSYFLNNEKIQKKYKVGIVPHLTEINDKIFENPFFKNKDVKIINPLDKCEDVIKEISQCETILSSSLHGLIVADSLHVPNCCFQIIGSKKAEGTYKYRDYYSVFSKDRLKIVSSCIVNKDLKVQKLKDIVLSEYIPADDEVEKIKKNLIDSFEKVNDLLNQKYQVV